MFQIKKKGVICYNPFPESKLLNIVGLLRKHEKDCAVSVICELVLCSPGLVPDRHDRRLL